MKKKILKKAPLDVQKKELKEEKKKKKKKAFTLIELLAVIIILGILMVIAVPAVTKYINESRKTTYVTSAKSAIDGARNMIYSGELAVNDLDTTYYIPASYIKMEKELKTPYGEMTEAYIGVVFNGDNYDYYWISNDTSGTGIKDITSINILDGSLVTSNIEDTDVRSKVETTGINGRSKILILKDDGSWESVREASEDTTGENNMYYLYSTDEATANIGFSVEKNGNEYVISGSANGRNYYNIATHIFDNPQDALNDIKYFRNPSVSQKFFMRFRVVDNKIDKIDLGYFLNNKINYLKALNERDYSNNERTLLNTFGSERCETGENCAYDNNGDLIRCYARIDCVIQATETDPGLMVSATEDGRVDAFDGILGDPSWSCNIGPEWSWCVVPF